MEDNIAAFYFVSARQPQQNAKSLIQFKKYLNGSCNKEESRNETSLCVKNILKELQQASIAMSQEQDKSGDFQAEKEEHQGNNSSSSPPLPVLGFKLLNRSQSMKTITNSQQQHKFLPFVQERDNLGRLRDCSTESQPQKQIALTQRDIRKKQISKIAEQGQNDHSSFREKTKVGRFSEHFMNSYDCNDLFTAKNEQKQKGEYVINEQEQSVSVLQQSKVDSDSKQIQLAKTKNKNTVAEMIAAYKSKEDCRFSGDKRRAFYEVKSDYYPSQKIINYQLNIKNDSTHLLSQPQEIVVTHENSMIGKKGFVKQEELKWYKDQSEKSINQFIEKSQQFKILKGHSRKSSGLTVKAEISKNYQRHQSPSNPRQQQQLGISRISQEVLEGQQFSQMERSSPNPKIKQNINYFMGIKDFIQQRSRHSNEQFNGKLKDQTKPLSYGLLEQLYLNQKNSEEPSQVSSNQKSVPSISSLQLAASVSSPSRCSPLKNKKKVTLLEKGERIPQNPKLIQLKRRHESDVIQSNQSQNSISNFSSSEKRLPSISRNESMGSINNNSNNLGGQYSINLKEKLFPNIDSSESSTLPRKARDFQRAYEQMRQNEERQFHIENDQIALDFDSVKEQKGFQQRILQTKQRLRRMQHNLNTASDNFIKFFNGLGKAKTDESPQEF